MSIIRNFIAKGLFKKSGVIANREAVDFSTNALIKRLENYNIKPTDITSEDQLLKVLNGVKQAEDNMFNNRFRDMMENNKFFNKQSDNVVDLKNRKLNTEKPILGGTQETDEQILKRLKKQNEDSINRLKNKKDPPEELAGGGVAGLLGERPGYDKGLKVQGSGSMSGKNQIQGAPEGITSNKSFINLIANLDIPISEKISLLGDVQYSKFRDKIEKGDEELFLEDPASYLNKKIGIGINQGNEGFSGSAKYDVDSGEPEFNILFKKSFAQGGRTGFRGGGAYQGGSGAPGSAKSSSKSSTNQGPAGGASSGGNYGGNRNPNQTYGGGGGKTTTTTTPTPKTNTGITSNYMNPTFRKATINFLNRKQPPKSFIDNLKNIYGEDVRTVAEYGKDTNVIDAQARIEAGVAMPGDVDLVNAATNTTTSVPDLSNPDVLNKIAIDTGMPMEGFINKTPTTQTTRDIKSIQDYKRNPDLQFNVNDIMELNIGQRLGEPKIQSIYDLVQAPGQTPFMAAQGGPARQNFAMGKRAFLKLLAGTGAGIAGLKSGLLGFGKKKIAKSVIAPATQAANEAAPPYFFRLVEKIKAMGDDASKLAVKDREKVTTYKDYTLTEDVTTGEKTIQRMKVDDNLKYDASEYYGKPVTEDVYMNYKPGKSQADETMKGKTPRDEYTEDTSLIRSDRPAEGGIEETFDGVPDDILEEVGETIVKKADGGRIGYAVGKKVIAKGIMSKINKLFGKGTMTTADKIAQPEKTIQQRIMEFEARNKPDAITVEPRQILDVPPMPSGFSLSKEKLLKKFPELDESFADELMEMDKNMQGRIIKMLENRRKNPEAYDKLLDEKGDTLEFQAAFDEITRKSNNADGGRIGLSGGGGLLKLLKLLKPKPKKLETVKSFLEKRQFLKDIVGNTEKNKKARELKMLKDAMEESRNNPGFKFENVDIDKDIRPIFDKEIVKSLKKNRKLNATGGLAAMLGE